jgi:hypothetical protein
MNRKSITTALLSAMLAAPLVAVAQDHDIEHLVIEMASTPEEHQAVGQHYTMKAAEAREEARRHEGMARVYAGGGGRSARPGGRQHCENLAAKFDEIAVEYDALAKLHQELGKPPAR